jgi:HEAT repeat protein
MTRSSGKQNRLAVAATAAIALVAWLILWPDEPRVAGLPASEYVKSILSSNVFDGTLVTNHLMSMGTDVAVTAIARLVEREDSRWKHQYRTIHPKLPLWFRNRVAAPKTDPQLILRSAMALGYFGAAAEPAVPVLADSYERGDSFIKSVLAATFSRLGPTARHAIPALLQDAVGSVRRSSGSQVNIAAIRALASVDPRGAASARELVPLLMNSNSWVALATVQTLGIMAKHSPWLVPKLAEPLDHPSWMVNQAAANQLKELKALKHAHIAPFLQRLSSSDSAERARGAAVLRQAEEFAREVTPALVRTVSDPESSVREAALRSLYAFARSTNVAAVHRALAAEAVLKHGPDELSWPMIGLLPQLVPQLDHAIPLLVAALGNPGERIRGNAAQTLGTLGPAARDAIPFLEKLLTDEWQNVREAATNALVAITASPSGETARP